MTKHTIIWDFDGTILPLSPYDSEQALLMHLLNRRDKKMSLFNRLFTRFVVFADRREWFRRVFKMHFERSLRGKKIGLLDHFAELIATTIPSEDRNTYHALKENGHEMVVLSCGTADLSERILMAAGIWSFLVRSRQTGFVLKKIKSPELMYICRNLKIKLNG